MPMISASRNQIGRRSPKSVRSSPIVLESEAATGIKQPARRRAKAKQNSIVIFTVGHSTRAIEEFEDLLLAHGVKQLVDIRTIPRSRHNPQFNGDRLPGSLKKSWNSLPSHAWTWRFEARASRFHQFGMAQCQLPRFC